MHASSVEAKNKRYDRQLRLWGEHGQRAMEECSLCLINGSATGVETLKNLVLPGIGSFTVVDGAMVSAADTGNNFFVESSAIGTPRAACVTRLLQELNEHVAGSFINEDISQVLEARPSFLHAFDVVVATQTDATQLKQISAICEERRVPLLIVHSYGFLGYLRLSLPEHQVIEAHNEHAIPDLRVLSPPAGLQQLIASRYADLPSLCTSQYAHVPFVVLLVKAVEAWAAANGGALPTQFKQKKEVRAILESYRRADMQADQNIEEALAAVNTALQLAKPAGATATILSSARSRVSEISAELQQAASASGADAAVAKLSSSKPQVAFWLSAAAVAAFVDCEGGGLLPVQGSLPDMTCDSATYVALQAVYQQQAQADLAAVHAHLREISSMESLPTDLVSIESLKLFCKNTQGLQVLSFSSASEEYNSHSINTARLLPTLNDETRGGSLYLLLRAARAFRAERSRWPGARDSEVEGDVPILKGCLQDVAKELGVGGCGVSDDLIHEFCRWGGGEMHAIAAVMGGIASQEVIKAVTRQYVPLNNTFLFNGFTGMTTTLEL